jgi:hypothetical protein
MLKKTLNAKEVLDDIKAGMDDATLMGKYQLSEKGMQSLFKKLVDSGVLKQEELERRTPGLAEELQKRTPAPEKAAEEKAAEGTWICPICGNPQNTHYDKCPECSVIAARFQEKIATTQQLGAIKAQLPPIPEDSKSTRALADIYAPSPLDNVKEMLRSPYGLALVAISALIGFVIGAVVISWVG